MYHEKSFDLGRIVFSRMISFLAGLGIDRGRLKFRWISIACDVGRAYSWCPFQKHSSFCRPSFWLPFLYELIMVSSSLWNFCGDFLWWLCEWDVVESVVSGLMFVEVAGFDGLYSNQFLKHYANNYFASFSVLESHWNLNLINCDWFLGQLFSNPQNFGFSIAAVQLVKSLLKFSTTFCLKTALK